MRSISRGLLWSAVVVASCVVAFAQAPAAPQGGGRGPAAPRLVLSVTSPAWPDGGEVPMHHAGRGDNKSPAFEFHWSLGPTPAAAPDTLHWSAFNIPGTAKGLPEGLAAGELPDGTRNGPGIMARGGNPGSYFGPGAGPGPFHHYVFEFYALDAKLDLPATATRDDLLKAMEGHVIGKAAYTGRFHAQPQ